MNNDEIEFAIEVLKEMADKATEEKRHSDSRRLMFIHAALVRESILRESVRVWRKR